MTAQEAYERIRAYFSKPGARLAFDQHSRTCYYRKFEADTTLKCAVGCLIPDELYDPAMDRPGNQYGGTGIEEVLESIHPELKDAMGWDDETVVFLSEAQNVHDSAASFNYDIPHFLTNLDETAEYHGLDVARAKALSTPACPED